VILPHAWAGAKKNVQASSLLYFWPEIEGTFTEAQPGEFWRLPSSLHKGPLEKLAVTFPQPIMTQRPLP
jgi:hypothetical protein